VPRLLLRAASGAPVDRIRMPCHGMPMAAVRTTNTHNKTCSKLQF
jgi:hypothetical protein